MQQLSPLYRGLQYIKITSNSTNSGVAIFIRTGSAIEVMQRKVVKYGAKLQNKVGILALSNIGKGNQKKSVIVGCTHLKAGRSNENIRLLQMKMFFDEIQVLLNNRNYPVVFGGDLNARTGGAVYQLISGVSQLVTLDVKNNKFSELVTNPVANFTSAYGNYKELRSPLKEDELKLSKFERHSVMHRDTFPVAKYEPDFTRYTTSYSIALVSILSILILTFVP